MRMLRYAGVWLLVLVMGVWAGEYDLSRILELAEQNNRELQLARQDLKFASAQKLEAYSTALPKINVQLGYNRNFLQDFFFFTTRDTATGQERTTRFSFTFRNEFQMRATLNQTLYSFGKVGNAIKGAGDFSRMTRFQFEAKRQEVMANTMKAFYRALLLERVWEVARASEQNALENYQLVKTRYESGSASEFEMLQAEVRYENARPQTMQAYRDYQLALNSLKIQVGLPLDEPVHLVGSLQNAPPMPDSLPADSVLNRRPDYLALQWERQLWKRNVGVQKSNLLPTLLGTLTYTSGARSDRFRLDNRTSNIVLGINLQIPIFNGANTIAQIQKAKVDLRRAETRLRITEDNIRLSLQNALLKLREAQRRVEAARKSVATAQRALEIAQSRAANGLATQLELKDSQLFLDQARVNFYSAMFDYLDAYIDWQLATGQVRPIQS
ncbi:MAG: TolC family protein [Calditrichaeota bacterium]|nr:MAG: TolC family protein [Calditrichota bacterium]